MPSFFPEPRREIGSLDELHDEAERAVHLEHVHHLHDVRVVELDWTTPLVLEPPHVGGPARMDHLERVLDCKRWCLIR
jgi:hypothetical protein